MKHIDTYLSEMELKLADDPKAIENTWQAPYKENTECCHCEENARLAFVFKEDDADKTYVSSLHKNTISDNGKFWPHDAISVAVYFCEKCYEATALYNQG